MNILSSIFYILFSINILPNLLACVPRYKLPSNPRGLRSPSTDFYDLASAAEYFGTIDFETSEEDVNCNFTLLSPQKVINPYRSQIDSLVPMKPFGSFFQKCAACLAVATEIAKVIEISTQDTGGTIHKHQNLINEDIAKDIGQLCSKGFRNFDLRKYEDVSLVTDKHQCTEHIQTNMDGGWTKKLREVCNLYTAHMDLEHVSNNYANKTNEIAKNMCQGTGIFRDCLNVQEILPIESSIQELNGCSDNCTCATRRLLEDIVME